MAGKRPGVQHIFEPPAVALQTNWTGGLAPTGSLPPPITIVAVLNNADGNAYFGKNMMNTTNDQVRLSLLDSLFKAFNRHDADAVMACFDPSIIFEAAVGPDAVGRRIAGAEAVRAAFVATWTAMPDVQWLVRRHTVFGDRGITEWLFTATAPQGGRIDVEGVDLFDFTGALIISKSAFRKERPIQPVQ